MGASKPDPSASPRHASPVPASTPSPEASSDDNPAPPVPPESIPTPQISPGLDRLGWIQALGGLALGLIALFSSYDHISLFGRSLQLQQQWGIVFILASVATVAVDAQLATGSRLRGAYARLEDRQRADREQYFADRERNRAAEARERQAESLERQNETLDLLRRSALLSARVQLDPSDVNRSRLDVFLTLMNQYQLENPDL